MYCWSVYAISIDEDSATSDVSVWTSAAILVLLRRRPAGVDARPQRLQHPRRTDALRQAQLQAGSEHAQPTQPVRLLRVVDEDHNVTSERTGSNSGKQRRRRSRS